MRAGPWGYDAAEQWRAMASVVSPLMRWALQMQSDWKKNGRPGWSINR